MTKCFIRKSPSKSFSSAVKCLALSGRPCWLWVDETCNPLRADSLLGGGYCSLLEIETRKQAEQLSFPEKALGRWDSRVGAKRSLSPSPFLLRSKSVRFRTTKARKATTRRSGGHWAITRGKTARRRTKRGVESKNRKHAINNIEQLTNANYATNEMSTLMNILTLLTNPSTTSESTGLHSFSKRHEYDDSS